MKVLVIQHAALEHPGAMRSYMREANADIATVSIYEDEPLPELDAFDLMVVMGGVQDVWQEDQFPWLSREKEAIRRFVLELQRPYLGICLGHQLLVASTGGRVEPAVRGELGVLSVSQTTEGTRDPIFAGLPTILDAVQWHGAEAVVLPEGTRILAESDACAMQAVRVGRCGYGFQWHVEATSETVSDWSSQPNYHSYLEGKLPGGAAGLKRAVEDRSAQLRLISKRVYDNLIGLM